MDSRPSNRRSIAPTLRSKICSSSVLVNSGKKLLRFQMFIPLAMRLGVFLWQRYSLTSCLHSEQSLMSITPVGRGAVCPLPSRLLDADASGVRLLSCASNNLWPITNAHDWGSLRMPVLHTGGQGVVPQLYERLLPVPCQLRLRSSPYRPPCPYWRVWQWLRLFCENNLSAFGSIHCCISY